MGPCFIVLIKAHELSNLECTLKGTVWKLDRHFDMIEKQSFAL